MTGSLHDPRVLIHEPAKWVARLRATGTGAARRGRGTAGTDPAGSRVLFRAELGAGAHVGPAGRYDQLRYEAEILAFILTAAYALPDPRKLAGRAPASWRAAAPPAAPRRGQQRRPRCAGCGIRES